MKVSFPWADEEIPPLSSVMLEVYLNYFCDWRSIPLNCWRTSSTKLCLQWVMATRVSKLCLQWVMATRVSNSLKTILYDIVTFVMQGLCIRLERLYSSTAAKLGLLRDLSAIITHVPSGCLRSSQLPDHKFGHFIHWLRPLESQWWIQDLLNLRGGEGDNNMRR